MDQTATRLFDHIKPTLAALMLGVRCALGAAAGGLIPRRAYNAALKELRLAESLLRRIALLIAVTLDLTPRTPKPSPKTRRAKTACRPEAPFPIFDPWSHEAAEFSALPGAHPKEMIPASALRRRYDRLAEAAADPQALAARMARWMRNRDIRAEAEITERARPEGFYICRLGRPPGLEPKDSSLAASLLRGLQTQAHAAYPPP